MPGLKSRKSQYPIYSVNSLMSIPLMFPLKRRHGLIFHKIPTRQSYARTCNAFVPPTSNPKIQIHVFPSASPLCGDNGMPGNGKVFKGNDTDRERNNARLAGRLSDAAEGSGEIER